jgi:hypothetical protein
MLYTKRILFYSWHKDIKPIIINVEVLREIVSKCEGYKRKKILLEMRIPDNELQRIKDLRINKEDMQDIIMSSEQVFYKAKYR